MLKAITSVPRIVFRAFRDAVQTIPSLVPTKVEFNAETFDTNNNFASGRFTPTLAGYYQVNAGVRFASTYGFMRIMFYKNGSLYSIGTDNTAVASGSACDVIFCNGSTDYIEVYILTNAQVDIAGASTETFFSGALV